MSSAQHLGIETMQLIVVAATMPSLILMSRTRAYLGCRIAGALFAGGRVGGLECGTPAERAHPDRHRGRQRYGSCHVDRELLVPV